MKSKHTTLPVGQYTGTYKHMMNDEVRITLGHMSRLTSDQIATLTVLVAPKWPITVMPELQTILVFAPECDRIAVQTLFWATEIATGMNRGPVNWNKAFNAFSVYVGPNAGARPGSLLIKIEGDGLETTMGQVMDVGPQGIRFADVGNDLYHGPVNTQFTVHASDEIETRYVLPNETSHECVKCGQFTYHDSVCPYVMKGRNRKITRQQSLADHHGV